MRKLRTFTAIGLSLTMLAGVVGCNGGGNNNNQYSDYYTFDTSSITSELLYGSEMKIDPVIRNLGEVVNANYKVTVTLDGKDVTSSVYNKDTKTFAPAQQSDAIGTYTFNLTIVDAEGNNVLDDNGNAFSTSFNVDYCIANFVPKANAGSGVTVNNDDPLKPKISFDETYVSEDTAAKRDSGQYRLTGVNLSGDYEVVYKIKANAIGANEETRFFFGVDRTDENKRDDNIALNVNDGRLSAWFFQDAGQAGGADWSGTGWTSTAKAVQANVMDGEYHLIGFTRVISSTGNAYYVVTWDEEYFTTLNIRGNYTDTVGGVWVESVNVEGSIELESFRLLEADTTEPTVTLDYEDVGVGSEVDLTKGIIVIDEIYNTTSSIVWEVSDPEGEAVTVTGGKFTADKGGVYNVKVTVSDLKGNTTTKTATLNVYSDFTVTNVGLDKLYKAGSEATAKVTFTADDSAMIAATQAKLLKDGAEVANAVTGDATNGFKFTPAEAGIYTLRVSTVSAGRTISKDFEFTVSGAQAADIDMTRNTAVAAKDVAMMIYGEGAETLKVYKGETLADATDVTATIVDTYVTTTLENNVTYTYFRPTAAGTYYVVAQKGTGDTATLRAHKVNVVENGHNVRVYDDEKLDIGNGRLDKTVWGNNEMIFLNTGAANYETSKVVYDGKTLAEGDFAIEFKVTDFSFCNVDSNSKMFFSMYFGGWCDFFIEGALRDADSGRSECWGYGSNFPGTSWIEYQWRSIWQAPVTDAFVPDNDPDYDGEGNQYAFRDGTEYAQYLTGTHTYRVEFRQTAEAGVYNVYFFIDGRPEATHRNVPFGGTSLTCLVANSQQACGVMHDLRIIDDIEEAEAE